MMLTTAITDVTPTILPSSVSTVLNLLAHSASRAIRIPSTKCMAPPQHGCRLYGVKQWEVDLAATCGSRKVKSIAPHVAHEVLLGSIPHVRITSSLLADRRRTAATIVVARVDDRGVVQRCQLPVEAEPHCTWVAPGKVDTSASIDEQGIAGKQAAICKVADRARRVARRVEHADREFPEHDFLTVRYRLVIPGYQVHEVRRDTELQCHLPHVCSFNLMHVDTRLRGFNQLWQTVDVIRMTVSQQNAGYLETHLRGSLPNRLDIPGGVDDGGLQGVLASEDVDEVHHRTDFHLLQDEG